MNTLDRFEDNIKELMEEEFDKIIIDDENYSLMNKVLEARYKR